MIDIIEDVILPSALMIGVDYELFWTLNPRSLSPFTKAFSLTQKYQDQLAWQQGLYIRQAIASCFSKEVKYPTKPTSSIEVKNEPVAESPEEIKAKFLKHAMLLNTKFGKEDNQ